jgi:hypothetical protein
MYAGGYALDGALADLRSAPTYLSKTEQSGSVT